MFADDTEIYRTITSDEDSIYCRMTKNSITSWCSVWLMDLKYKCKCILFGNHVIYESLFNVNWWGTEEDISVKRVC